MCMSVFISTLRQTFRFIRVSSINTISLRDLSYSPVDVSRSVYLSKRYKKPENSEFPTPRTSRALVRLDKFFPQTF